MSVYKSKRSTSAIQYVENARQLQVFTIKNCVKFPKRYTYIVVQKIANLVEDIDTHVRVAESMMPTNLHEAQLKRDELTYTFGLLNSLDDKLQLMYDIVSDNPNFKMEFKWLPNAMLEWGRLIQKERDLITGVKKREAERRIHDDDVRLHGGLRRCWFWTWQPGIADRCAYGRKPA